MLTYYGLGFNLSTIPLIVGGDTRSISAENPTGEKGAGGKEASSLGVGRKGRPCICLEKGESVCLANITCTGVLRSFWITVTDKTSNGNFVLRDLVLRIFWDEEKNPSVEAPLGDFFCNGFGARCDVNSLPIAVNPAGGMNCYFPMPFRRSAKITIENQHAANIDDFYYQFTYDIVDKLPDEAGYFHACWHRQSFSAKGKDYVIADGIKGRGHYVGTYLAWAALERYWWGEGEIKFYLDGDRQYPTICGTGTEDYFGGAWCFLKRNMEKRMETTYCTPFLGYPYYSKLDEGYEKVFGEASIPMHGLYRWHIMDPIIFNEDLKVTIQQIGGSSGRGLSERADDISSVAYWYQHEPHSVFKALLPVEERWPR